jgi:hypothetical protein
MPPQQPGYGYQQPQPMYGAPPAPLGFPGQNAMPPPPPPGYATGYPGAQGAMGY